MSPKGSDQIPDSAQHLQGVVSVVETQHIFIEPSSLDTAPLSSRVLCTVVDDA